MNNPDQLRPEWISRAECARRLGVSAMAVTKFCQHGMPFRSRDRKVYWPDALFWSDWFRRPRRDLEGYDPDEAARELRSARAEAWYRAWKAGDDRTSVTNNCINRRDGPRS